MRPYFAKVVLNTPFDIRNHNYTIKPETRTLPAIGTQIAAAGENEIAKILADAKGLEDSDGDSLFECSTKDDVMAVFEADAVKDGLVFDLGGAQLLESILIWNYNKPGYTDKGIAKAAISVWTEKAGWKPLLKEAQLLEAEGTDDYDEPTLVTFEPVTAQKVRLDSLAGINDKNTQIGLSKIRFYSPLGPAACNPEPVEKSTIAYGSLVKLGWTGGKNALVHAVYLGETAANLSLLGKITGNGRADVEGLKPQTGYYWKIVEIQKDGTETESPVWSFTTEKAVTAHWPLDENPNDAQGVFNGTLQGSPQWVEGKFGKAMQLDGQSGSIEIAPLNTKSNSATICGWMRIEQDNAAYTPLFFCRKSQDMASGLNFKTGRTLGYHWKDDYKAYSWDSGIKVPLKQWVFAALTVTPSKAVIYLGDGQGMKTAVHETAHQAETFESPSLIGRDPQEKDRHFKGALDEMRFYSYALSEEQIKSLCTGQAMADASQIRLINANVVTDDQSLAQIAKQTEDQPAAPQEGRKKNLTAVLIIAAAVLGIGLVSAFKKKK